MMTVIQFSSFPLNAIIILLLLASPFWDLENFRKEHNNTGLNARLNAWMTQ